ncbi:MAG: CARDB domain-containing protein [Actinomycetota bacterium]
MRRQTRWGTKRSAFEGRAAKRRLAARRRRLVMYASLVLSLFVLVAQVSLAAADDVAPDSTTSTQETTTQDPPAESQDPPADETGGGEEEPAEDPPADDPADPPADGGDGGEPSDDGSNDQPSDDGGDAGTADGDEESDATDERVVQRSVTSQAPDPIISEDRAVRICHRTDSYTNPYVIHTPDVLGVDGSGPGDHAEEHQGPVWFPEIPKHTEWGDIIPAGTFGGITIEGLNWDDAGAAIWANNCQPLEPVPDILVTKDCPASADVGDEITYTIIIQNTGEDDLEDIEVNDTILGDLSGDFSNTLAIGDSETHDFQYTTSENDPDPLHNEVTAIGSGVVSGDGATSTADCDTDLIPPPVPDIEVTKDCPASATVGDEITYTIKIENNGEEDLENIEVNDTILGDLSSDFSGSLAQGASETHTFPYQTSENDPDPLHNEVTATGTGVESGDEATDDASCDTDLIPPPVPDIEVTKDCPASATVGDEITYTIKIENNGEEDLENIEVNDTILGDLSSDFSGSLAQGASETHTFPYQTSENDPDPLHNEVTATGTGVESGDEATDDASCDTDLIPPPGPVGIQVTKECDASVGVGGDVNYTITVINTGEQQLDDVVVMDSLLGDLSGDFPDSIAVGDSAFAVVQRTAGADDPDPLHNEVTAAARGAETDEEVSDDSFCDTDILHPAIEIVKTADPTSGSPGTDITYTYEVTNTGEVTLFNISVDDDILGHIGDIAQLDPGDSATVTTDTELGTESVHNVGTACGTDENENEVCDEDDADVTVLNPAIEIVKTADPISGSPGTDITYTYEVTNTGEVTLFNISVDDDILGHIGDIPKLDPDESATLTANMELGTISVHNVATACGTDENENEVCDDDDADVTVVIGEEPPPPPEEPPVVLPKTETNPQAQALAFTGITGVPLAIVAMLLALVGAALTHLGRKRRYDTE